MRGSELDAGLLGESGEPLHWMNTGVWSGEAKEFAHDTLAATCSHRACRLPRVAERTRRRAIVEPSYVVYFAAGASNSQRNPR